MSRYNTKKELLDVIRSTIETDYNRTGVSSVNMSAFLRDVEVIGDSYYGYTTMKTGDEFVDAIRRHARGPLYASQSDETP